MAYGAVTSTDAERGHLRGVAVRVKVMGTRLCVLRDEGGSWERRRASKSKGGGARETGQSANDVWAAIAPLGKKRGSSACGWAGRLSGRGELGRLVGLRGREGKGRAGRRPGWLGRLGSVGLGQKGTKGGRRPDRRFKVFLLPFLFSSFLQESKFK